MLKTVLPSRASEFKWIPSGIDTSRKKQTKQKSNLYYQDRPAGLVTTLAVTNSGPKRMDQKANKQKNIAASITGNSYVLRDSDRRKEEKKEEEEEKEIEREREGEKMDRITSV